MEITYERYEVGVSPTDLITTYKELQKRPRSVFEEIYGGQFLMSVDRGWSAARRAGMKYFCTYIVFEPDLPIDHRKLIDVSDFLKDFIDVDIYSLNFSPWVLEKHTTHNGATQHRWHAFVMEADVMRDKVGTKGYRYCYPRLTDQRAEVVARVLEIELGDVCRESFDPKYVNRHLRDLGYITA